MEQSTFEIYKGSDVTLTVSMEEKDTGLPVPLDNFSGATAYFADVNSEAIAVTGSLLSQDLGKVQFIMNETQTSQLKVGDDLDMEVVVIKNSDKLISQVIGKLTVLDRLFR